MDRQRPALPSSCRLPALDKAACWLCCSSLRKLCSSHRAGGWPWHPGGHCKTRLHLKIIIIVTSSHKNVRSQDKMEWDELLPVVLTSKDDWHVGSLPVSSSSSWKSFLLVSHLNSRGSWELEGYIYYDLRCSACQSLTICLLKSLCFKQINQFKVQQSHVYTTGQKCICNLNKLAHDNWTGKKNISTLVLNHVLLWAWLRSILVLCVYQMSKCDQSYILQMCMYIFFHLFIYQLFFAFCISPFLSVCIWLVLFFSF